MAHEVEEMFSVKKTPWHGLGTIVHEAPSALDAITLAGLNWQVVEAPIFREQEGSLNKILTHKLLYRDDSGKQLGVVGSGYEPLQNARAFSFFDPFIESGLASYETAGCLREGRRIWVLARLNKSPIEIGKGDVVEKFLLLSNGHDGTMAVRVGFTPIRVVCANTLAMAHEDSRLLRVFHSTKVHERLEQVQEIINAADAKFEATAEQYRVLASSNVSQKSLEQFVDIVFKYTPDFERRQMAKERRTQDIIRLFETGRGQDLPGAKGTYWGLYNAVTELLSYEKGASDDGRLNSLWFAESKNINNRAFQTAIKMAVS